MRERQKRDGEKGVDLYEEDDLIICSSVSLRYTLIIYHLLIRRNCL